MAVLDNWDVYSRVSRRGLARLRRQDGAFTIGEIIGDTLFVHIEKTTMPWRVGETVNKMFAARMTGTHPEVRYINREEDVGDPGAARPPSSPIIRLCCCRSSMWCVSRAVMT